MVNERNVIMMNVLKFFVGAVLALVCGGMLAGCSDWFAGDVEWSDDFGGAEVIGFIDDSLVIVYDFQDWYQDLGGFVTDHGEKNGVGHQRLCVYNFRVQEDGPRWCDTLDNENVGDFDYVKGQLSDSVVWGDNGSKTYSFWKLGESPRTVKVSEKMEDCTGKFRVVRMRPWKNGEIFIQGPLTAEGYSCQYAVLDTNEKTITYKRLDENLKWIQKCDDVRAWDEDVYCFMPGEHAFEGRLLRNGNDTVDVPVEFTIGDFFGNILRPNAYLCNFVGDKLDCLDVEWRGGLTFYRDDEVFVSLE